MVLNNILNTYVPLRAQIDNNSNGKVKKLELPHFEEHFKKIIKNYSIVKNTNRLNKHFGDIEYQENPLQFFKFPLNNLEFLTSTKKIKDFNPYVGGPMRFNKYETYAKKKLLENFRISI